MDDLKFFDLPEEKSITKKTKEKTKKVQSIMIQKSVLRNALKLHDKRTGTSNAFVNKDILPGNLETELFVILKIYIQTQNHHLKKIYQKE